MSFGEYSLKLLFEDTEIMPFRCADKDLNDFLLTDAKKYYRQLLAVTYLLEDVSKNKTVAYFSLLNDGLTYDPGGRFRWSHLARHIDNAKRRKYYPAVKLGRLAVSEEYVGKGVGRDILDFIMFTLVYVSPSACRFLTVDAYRSAVGFYEKAGFEFLTKKDEGGDTRLMYYDLMDFLKDRKQV